MSTHASLIWQSIRHDDAVLEHSTLLVLPVEPIMIVSVRQTRCFWIKEKMRKRRNAFDMMVQWIQMKHFWILTFTTSLHEFLSWLPNDDHNICLFSNFMILIQFYSVTISNWNCQSCYLAASHVVRMHQELAFARVHIQQSICAIFSQTQHNFKYILW